MEINKIKELLNKSSMLILNYQEGDLFLISEIIDVINEINHNFDKYPECKNILIILLNSLNSLLKGQIINNFNDIFSIAIDLLVRFINEIEGTNKKTNEIDDLLKIDINSFEKENKNFIYSETFDSSKEINKKKIEKDQKENKKKESELDKLSKVSIESESLKIFIVEAEDKLTSAQDIILQLEKDLKNKELLNELFRIFHTIKGECGFLRLASLGELAHNLENLLDLIRNDQIENNSKIIDTLLSGIDYSNKMISSLKNGNITVFNQININKFIEEINNQTQTAKISIGEILQKEGKLSESDVQKILQKQKEVSFTKKFGEIAVENNYITEEEISESLEKQKKPEELKTIKTEKTDPFIKVKASQINYLVDMVGELLIAENQLEDKNMTLLKKITREIQIAAMQLRTVKVKNLFINLRRIIRDVSLKLNKEVNAEIFGEELEIDRNIVEALEEPLMHIIRNSIGHGIETPEEREQKGKTNFGIIIVKAERRGNNIVISVKDDGRGLNKEKIINKAVTKNLVDKERAKTLTENEIFNFIFLPGFSTSENVDIVSGRGVGMDIVKKTISNLRGAVEIQSEENNFTEISLIFPLSMAIIDGMIVESRGIPFIIPVSNIIESLQINDDMIYSVENKTSVINLREEIIPIIDIHEYFNIEIEKNINLLRKLAIIVESSKRKYAFLVDEIIAKKEVVIKSLGNKFKNLKGIASGTVLTGGKVGFVLNVEQIVDIIE